MQNYLTNQDDPKILVLDEATANIDTESEEIIQHAIETVMAGRTSIIIAHRLSTIRHADCIYLLKQGKIIDKGDYQQLLEANSEFREMANVS